MTRLSALADQSRVLDFQTTEDADPDLTNDIRDAVAQLDFETAERIARNTELASLQRLRTSSQQFFSQSEEALRETDDKVTRERERISREAAIAIDCVKNDFQNRFTRLVIGHRREAEDLKNKWISHHSRAEAVARKKIDDLIHTSKVLASLQSFASAKDVRDRTHSQEAQIIADEVAPGDTHFREQFEKMIQRHQHQYNSLIEEMNRGIELARGEAAVQESKARRQGALETALSPVKMMERINDSNLSPLEKRSLIMHMSPGRLSDMRSPQPKMAESPTS